MRIVYRLLLFLIFPFTLLWLEFRARRQTGAPDVWRERLGFAPALPDGCLWLHAASVGEMQAAIPLVKALRARYPEQHLLVTSFTATGRMRAGEAFAGLDNVTIATLPWDSPGCVQRFIRRVQPRLFIILETEIWPTLLTTLARCAIPAVLLSARLTERTAQRYQRFAAVLQPALAGLRLVGAQSATEAARYRDLGTLQVAVHGNIKFDLDLPAGIREQGEAVRMSLFAHRPVLIAASTRDGEESILLDVAARLRAQLPDVLLILAPRYPERGNEVFNLTAQRGFNPVRRSSGEVCNADCGVFVLDTLGELLVFYAASDVAFVGGSLAPIGGHNLVEPAALGLPVLSGPHVENAPDIAQALVTAGGAFVLADAVALSAAALPLLRDAEQRERVGEAARAMVAANRGALARGLDALQGILAAVKQP